MNGHPLRPYMLPCCGYVPDRVAALDASGAKPRAGDVTLCIECGAILLFTTPPEARLAGPEDIADMAESGILPDVLRAKAAIRTLPKRKPRRDS